MTEQDDLNQILTEQDKTLMVAWTLPNDGPLTDAQRRDAMANFSQYLDARGLTFKDVGQRVDSPKASTIRELVMGTYRRGCDEHIRKLNAWLEVDYAQRISGLDNAFVKTGVAERIHKVARLVIENMTMGLAYGPTGIGKTKCAHVLTETYAGTVMITIGSESRRPRGLAATLADALNTRTSYRARPGSTNLSRVKTTLRGSRRLIIVDEAHKLELEGIELLRELHDTAGVPVLFLATKEMADRIERSADPDAGQVYSRFDLIYDLAQGRDPGTGGKPLFTVAEIRELFERTPIKLAADAARYLQDVASTLGRGSLRRCRILLTNGARRARRRQNISDEAKVTVTADDLAFVDRSFKPGLGNMSDTRRRLDRAARVESA